MGLQGTRKMTEERSMKATKHKETTSSFVSPSFKVPESGRIFEAIITYTVPAPSKAPDYGNFDTG